MSIKTGTNMNLITESQLAELWTIPGTKPPCRATMWKRRLNGLAPKPIRVGRSNLYNQNEAIKLRDLAWGLAKK